MVGGVDGQAQDARRRQRHQAHRAGRGRVQVGEALAVAMVQHLQHRRVVQGKARVLRHGERADGRKGEHVGAVGQFRVGHAVGRAGDDLKALVVAAGDVQLHLQGAGHAVDVVEGVGEVAHVQAAGGVPLVRVRGKGDMRSAAGCGPGLPQRPQRRLRLVRQEVVAAGAGKGAVLGEQGVPHEVRGQDGVERPGRAHHVEHAEQVRAHGVVQQGVGEGAQHLFRGLVGKAHPGLFGAFAGDVGGGAVQQPAQFRVAADDFRRFRLQVVLHGARGGRGKGQARAAVPDEPVQPGQQAALRFRRAGQHPVGEAQHRVAVDVAGQAEALFVELVGDGIQVVGHGHRGGGAALRRAAPFHHPAQGVAHAAVAHAGNPFDDGVAAGDVQRGMVVRPGHEVLHPRPLHARGHVLPVGHGVHVGRGQPLHDGPQDAVLEIVTRAVQFEHPKEQQQPFHVVQRQALVQRVHGVGAGVGNARDGQVVHQVVDVFAQAGDVGVVRLGQVPGQHVDLAAVFGEIGGDFLADEGVVQVGDFKAARQGVVVGDGDQVHAPAAGDVVQRLGVGVAFRAAQLLQNPLRGAGGVARVHVQVHRQGGAACARAGCGCVRASGFRRLVGGGVGCGRGGAGRGTGCARGFSGGHGGDLLRVPGPRGRCERAGAAAGWAILEFFYRSPVGVAGDSRPTDGACVTLR